MVSAVLRRTFAEMERRTTIALCILKTLSGDDTSFWQTNIMGTR